MSKARRQHFVPRFYLKNFGDPKIFCYDKSNDNVVETNANDIALGKNFYELEGLKGGLIEEFLSENESKFSKAYYELINKKDISKLSEESVIYFFLLIAVQFLRTQEFRFELGNVYSQALTKLYSKPVNELLNKKGSKLAGHVRISSDPETVKLMQVRMMIENVPKFAQIFASKKWVIRENNHDIPLWTSDNPIALHNTVDLGPYMGNLGLKSKGIEIHFPLTKNLLLFSFDPTTHRLKENTTMLERLNVIHENIQMQLMRSSFRFIYASSNNDFDRAKKFLSEYQQFRGGTQRRKVY